MELKGSKTEKNLELAFAGESQAVVKYRYYASCAKKDGYERISEVFKKTSDNEFEHAKIWFKLLNGDKLPTLGNLKDAANGEKYEGNEMYIKFAKDARDEGFDHIAELFEGVAAIEKDHERTYNCLADKVSSKTVFVADGEVAWICRNCGHIHFGKEAPEICSICAHPKAFFQKRG